ncbi:MAG: SCO family protein [Thermoanaerobaculia bacterium]
MKRFVLLVTLIWAVPCFAIPPGASQGPGPKAIGQTSDRVPKQFEGVNIEQRLGEQIPLDAEFVDSTGTTVLVADLVGERPALLVPVYYDCPMLCSMVLETLTKSLKTLKLEVGRDFDVVVFSFDSSETPEQAAKARKRWAHDYDPDSSGTGWHFLVGDDANIGRMTASIGFAANRDDASGDFAHAAALFVLTSDGRIARLFFGLSYPPRDLRLALVDAGEGSVGSVVDQVLLYCFRYDPATGRYSAAILRIVRATGILTALAIAGFVFLTWRRERSRSYREQAV